MTGTIQAVIFLLTTGTLAYIIYVKLVEEWLEETLKEINNEDPNNRL